MKVGIGMNMIEKYLSLWRWWLKMPGEADGTVEPTKRSLSLVAVTSGVRWSSWAER